MKNLLHTPLGIEIESAVVHEDSLTVLSNVDKILSKAYGSATTDWINGPITWSNELVNHVIEFKVTKPEVLSDELARKFHTSMNHFSSIADTFDGAVLPTGMHPTMIPTSQTQIWPGKYHEHYMTYHKLFNCFTHGFANLQSVHINIPFNTEEDFGRLLASIRIVLPLIPALAASSPILEGKNTGYIDNRLEVYRTNQKKVTSITGLIIPEQIFDYASYKKEILEKMYKDIAPYDTNSILQTEQLNSRGCIARFDRNTLEIRLIDAQENPNSDIAIASAVVFLVNAVLHETWASYETQKKIATDELYDLLSTTIKTGERTLITNKEYLEQFGIQSACTAQELLTNILQVHIQEQQNSNPSLCEVLKGNLENGPLARRILARLPKDPSQKDLLLVYKELASNFRNNTSFV